MTLKSRNKPGAEDFTRMETKFVLACLFLRQLAETWDMPMVEALFVCDLDAARHRREIELRWVRLRTHFLLEIGTSDPFPEAEAGDKIEP